METDTPSTYITFIELDGGKEAGTGNGEGDGSTNKGTVGGCGASLKKEVELGGGIAENGGFKLGSEGCGMRKPDGLDDGGVSGTSHKLIDWSSSVIDSSRRSSGTARNGEVDTTSDTREDVNVKYSRHKRSRFVKSDEVLEPNMSTKIQRENASNAGKIEGERHSDTTRRSGGGDGHGGSMGRNQSRCLHSRGGNKRIRSGRNIGSTGSKISSGEHGEMTEDRMDARSK